jgi:hypothetical protein
VREFGRRPSSGEVRLHLVLAVGAQDTVEQAAFRKVLLKAVPDGNNLRVVGDRTEEERFLAHRVAPSE